MKDTHTRLFEILHSHRGGMGDSTRVSLTQALVLLLDELAEGAPGE